MPRPVDLVGTHRVITPDLPGHGGSELISGPSVRAAQAASIRYGWHSM
jgi:pimeloyl-ACP methyl ester carboxylesterase